MAGAQFTGVNLVVNDMSESLAFYRRLGVEIPEEQVWTTQSGPHHATAAGGDADLELDSVKLAQAYNAGFKAERRMALIGIAMESREAVDLAWANMIAEGAQGLQPPFDAPWGTRFAIIEDPDGNPVALQSPVDPARRGPPYDL